MAPGWTIPAGRPHLRSERITIDGRSFPNGAHLAEVKIDPETRGLVLDHSSVVGDFDVLTAPNLVKDRVHGEIERGSGR